MVYDIASGWHLNVEHIQTIHACNPSWALGLTQDSQITETFQKRLDFTGIHTVNRHIYNNSVRQARGKTSVTKSR